MPSLTFNWYDQASEILLDGTVDLDNDSFEVSLHTSSYTPDVTHVDSSDLTNELSSSGGYTAQTLSGITWNRSGAVTTFTSNSVSWIAVGADFDPARYWVLRDTTADRLIAYGLIDSSDIDVQLLNTQTLTFANPDGWFEIFADVYSTVFSPDDIPDLVSWVDAGLSTILNSSSQQVVDEEDIDQIMEDLASGAVPDYWRDNSPKWFASFNGHPAIVSTNNLVNGGPHAYTTGDVHTPIVSSDEITMICVASCDANAASGFGWMISTGKFLSNQQGYTLLIDQRANEGNVAGGIDWAAISQTYVKTGTTLMPSWAKNMISMRSEGSGGAMEGYYNGESIGTVTLPANTYYSSSAEPCMFTINATGNSIQEAIHAFAIYDRRLTSSEMSQLHEYFSRRFRVDRRVEGAWEDLSGFDRDFSPTVDNTDDLFITEDGVDQTDSVGTSGTKYDHQGPDLSGLTEGEIFAYVYKPSGSDGGLWRLGTETVGSFYPLSGATIYEDFGRSSRVNVGSYPEILDEWKIINVVSTSSDWEYFLDGNSESFVTPNTVSFPTDPIIGNDSRGGLNWRSNAIFRVIIFYDSAVTPAERDLINQAIWGWGPDSL